MIGDLDVIVYIFLQSAELALLPHTYFERIEEKKKPTAICESNLLCQISTEDLCKNVICLAGNANTLFRKKR